MSSLMGKTILFRGETIPRQQEKNLISDIRFQLKKKYCQWFLHKTKFILTSCYLNQKAFEQYEINKDFILLRVQSMPFVENSEDLGRKKGIYIKSQYL